MATPEGIYDPCSCGSGKKYKFCCYQKERKAAKAVVCGICGKTKNLIKTECCGSWICDDEDNYQTFSYARTSCSRNHRRYTLCGTHHTEKHEGHWQDCALCRDGVETEMYVWYGTNDYNFEKLKNPPAFEPTQCSGCKRVIVLGEETHTQSGDEYFCERCGSKMIHGLISKRQKKAGKLPSRKGGREALSNPSKRSSDGNPI